MSAIFPKWTNRLPVMIIIGGVLVGSAVTAGVWYYFTPKYSRVGYQPIQPVAFSHAMHAGPTGHGLPLLPQRGGEILVLEHPGQLRPA